MSGTAEFSLGFYEMLALEAQAGCQDSFSALVEAFTPLAKRLSYRYFLPGADRQDILQEALSGLVIGVRQFQPRYDTSFADYAALCIRNALIRSVRAATRKKHQILNQAKDLEVVLDFPGASGPEEAVVGLNFARSLMQKLKYKLSELELEVLQRRLDGASSSEICGELGVTGKQLENALFRARLKARQALEQLQDAA